MESKSPQCPYTVTVRRNPPRRAKKTPATNLPHPSHSNVVTSSTISSAAKNIIPFSLEDVLLKGDEVSQNPIPPVLKPPSTEEISENIRVFLRIRPLDIKRSSKKFSDGAKTGRSRSKAISPKLEKKKKIDKLCLAVIDSQSVTLSPPQYLQDARRLKTEVYAGFTHVFQSDSSQAEVYDRVMDPLVSDFILGKSGMLAAMGPTGSGKTHTVFGCPREPGVVPLALRKIFNCKGENCSSQQPRSYYISLFEISSERGRGERIFDLSPDGADLCMQQSIIKGLQEVLVSDVSEAEALITRGMLKRATAMTNSNSQSSRSQCIINIRAAPKTFEGTVEVPPNYAILTIVDLAGAEKEKKTGNQGTRLLESNFINNTSMVFGQCLRSLLEHQKNPKKAFQKHFQNSLLTKYLRDYLEGKKRMTLILTVKPGEHDYLDTSGLLRQASPFMKIKFSSVEEQSNFPYQKRQISAVPRVEQPKRRKFGNVDTSEIDGKSARDELPVLEKEVILEHCQKREPNSSCMKKCCNELAEMKRKEKVMKNFSKALWNVLKEYKKKFEESEVEVQTLQKNIKEENARYFKLEKELEHLKSRHSYYSRQSFDASSCIQVGTDADFGTNGSPQLTVAKSNNLYKAGVDYIPPNIKPEECNHERCNTSEKHIGEISMQVECSESSDLLMYDSDLSIKDLKHYQGNTPLTQCVNENSKSFSEEENDAQDPKVLKDLDTMNNFSEISLGSAELMTSTSHSNISVGDEKCPPMKKKVVSIIAEGEAEDLKDLKHLETADNVLSLHITENCLGCTKSMSTFAQSNMSVEDDKCSPMEQKKESFREEKDSTGSKDSMLITSSSQSQILAGDEKCPPMEQMAVSGSSGSPSEEVDFDSCNARKCEPERSSPCKPSDVEKKPRRRLLPASSILLKEISVLDLEVDNVEPKGGRGGRKLVAAERGLSQGSASLLRLLRSNCHV